MSKTTTNQTLLQTDVLIIGSGLAGLLSAIRLFDAGAHVVLASKAKFAESNTSFAQGGLAGVLTENGGDNIQQHLNDTIKSGAGLTVESVAKEIIGAAPKLVRSLAELGVAFDKAANGQYELAREGGHSHERILHAKDTTGRTISGALLKQLHSRAARDRRRLVLLEECFAQSLLTRLGRVAGAVLTLSNGSLCRISSASVILATGGAGQMYARTTNPSIATADGIALAYRAGAALTDLEFMQFHPTALSLPGAPCFLISEAVRGAGATLRDGHGDPFAHKFHPQGDLATRDVVARAIHATMTQQKLDSVFLDLTPIGANRLLQEFPNIVQNCRRFNLDPLKQPIPVAPAAHYFMGGVMTDAHGRSTVPGLYCIGEVACSGLHGANRLASNSLLEAGVMAMKIADLLISSPSVAPLTVPASESSIALDIVARDFDRSSTIIGAVRANQTAPNVETANCDFRQTMFERAGLIRSGPALSQLVDFLALKARHEMRAPSEANLLLVAELVARAALNRHESRGAHFREEMPTANDLLTGKHQVITMSDWIWTTAVEKAETVRHALSA